MHTQTRNYLTAVCSGTKVPAALRLLHNAFGMSGTDIAFALGRDRTMVSAYLNGRQDMPEKVVARLRDTLRECITVAKTIPTDDASGDELLEAIVNRAETLLESL